MPDGGDLVVRREEPPRVTSPSIFRDLVIKPTFPGSRSAADLRRAADRQEREAVAGGEDARRSQPRMSRRSTWRFPPFRSGRTARCSPRHVVMRVLRWPSGGAYAVMPGGLTRISTSLDNMVVSMQSGGGSKDTWVLRRRPAPQFSLLRPATRRARSQPRDLRSAQPRRRQSVLAGPLRGARGAGGAGRCAPFLPRCFRKAIRRAAGLKAGAAYSGGTRLLRSDERRKIARPLRLEQEAAGDDLRSGGAQRACRGISTRCGAWRGCCATAFRWTRG